LPQTVIEVGVESRDDGGVKGGADGRDGDEILTGEVLKDERQNIKIEIVGRHHQEHSRRRNENSPESVADRLVIRGPGAEVGAVLAGRHR
jgi:hypothetical protein